MIDLDLSCDSCSIGSLPSSIPHSVRSVHCIQLHIDRSEIVDVVVPWVSVDMIYGFEDVFIGVVSENPHHVLVDGILMGSAWVVFAGEVEQVLVRSLRIAWYPRE